MQQLKNFTQEGNVYKLKTQYGISVPLCGAFLLLALFGFLNIPESSFKWWMLAIFIFCLISFLRSYLFVDMDKKEMRARMGLGSEKTIPLADFQGFTIHKLKQLGFITTNVTLIARYTRAGKDSEIRLAQSFFTRPIQNILNDMDEILGHNDQ